jgi:hypothetical protein
LDLAEYLAEKNSEEEERLEIVDFLRNWTPEKYPVDDAVIVATAREVSNLNFLSTLLLFEKTTCYGNTCQA